MRNSQGLSRAGAVSVMRCSESGGGRPGKIVALKMVIGERMCRCQFAALRRGCAALRLGIFVAMRRGADHRLVMPTDFGAGA
ncbi:hypothetical protein GCM10011341_17420 [Frigidibacter albus]|nr:hypothetical protein GCM10011341_17420 [Frigidibacter albus]